MPGYDDDNSGPEQGVTFASLGVPAPIVDTLARTGITAPFPVQTATLPDAPGAGFETSPVFREAFASLLT